MDPDFWHERWAADEIGFHQHETNRHLEQFWSRLGLTGGRILVPLCGKSLDMLWLQRHGHTVAGIEISPLAVEAFFTEAGMQPERTAGPACTRWSAGGIDLYCGDFFELRPADIGPVDAFFDRAALVALPRSRRPAYVNHLIGFLPASARGLLVTLDYDQDEMDGPPFAVSPGEVDTLLADKFTIDHVLEENVLDSNPSFRERGLSRLTEHACLLVRS